MAHKQNDAGDLLRIVGSPMLATSADSPPRDSSRWIFELKYDGYRGLAARSGDSVALRSRNGRDLLDRFPHLESAIRALPVGEVVLDSEIVSFDESGAPRFERIQQGSPDAILVAFDLLWLNGKELRREPLESRLEELNRILGGGGVAGITIATRLEGPGDRALSVAASRGYEGIVAKRRGSKYENRRSPAWIKIKAVNEQEFVVVGYTPSKRGDHEAGALLLAYRDSDEWRLAGRVGTGFSESQRSEIVDVLSRIVDDACPIAGNPTIPEATWVEPRVVAQVRFREWTSDGMLRHPSFVGFRTDREPLDVTREPAASPPRVLVKLTSPERLLYPRDGIRKLDLADYYDALAEPLITALRGRPTGLEHWNDGLDGDSWLQQDLGRDAEEWMTTGATPLRSAGDRVVNHLVVDRRETLRWLAQRSVLTIHTWASRLGALESPDWVVFDLDPARGKGIEQAVEAANVFRGLFDELGIPSLPKTSGQRGIHLIVFLEPGHTWSEVARFAERISRAVASSVEGITIERSLEKRKGRLYADHLQNAYGKMIVAPYSPRGLDGAPVSAPLLWKEVTKRLDPLRFSIRSMPRRLARMGDLWAEAMVRRVRLPRLG